jgi:hypothetical protein
MSFDMENAYPSSDFGAPAYFLGDYLSLTSSGNDFLVMFGQTLSTPISSNIFFRRVEHGRHDEGDGPGGSHGDAAEAPGRAVTTALQRIVISSPISAGSSRIKSGSSRENRIALQSPG